MLRSRLSATLQRHKSRNVWQTTTSSFIGGQAQPLQHADRQGSTMQGSTLQGSTLQSAAVTTPGAASTLARWNSFGSWDSNMSLHDSVLECAACSYALTSFVQFAVNALHSLTLRADARSTVATLCAKCSKKCCTVCAVGSCIWSASMASLKYKLNKTPRM